MANNIDNDLLREVTIIRQLLTRLLLADRSKTDSIVLLSECGMQPKDIAEIVGTTSNSVSVTLSKKRTAPKTSGKDK